MGEKVKMVNFVTLVIKHTEIKPIKGVPMKVEKITIFQKVCKVKNGIDAYQISVAEAQSKYPLMRIIAYTITELTEDIFDEELINNKEN